jgi:hypothetical protein
MTGAEIPPGPPEDGDEDEACDNCSFTNCPGCTIDFPVCLDCGHKVCANSAGHNNWWCDVVTNYKTAELCCDGECRYPEGSKEALMKQLPAWYAGLRL